MTDVVDRDPKGVAQAAKAALAGIEAISPRQRMIGAAAVIRRIQDWMVAEHARALADGATPEALAAAIARAERAEAVVGRAYHVLMNPEAAVAKAAVPTNSAAPVKRRRSLSPTRPVPKGGLTASGKKRGRPFKDPARQAAWLRDHAHQSPLEVDPPLVMMPEELSPEVIEQYNSSILKAVTSAPGGTG